MVQWLVFHVPVKNKSICLMTGFRKPVDIKNWHANSKETVRYACNLCDVMQCTCNLDDEFIIIYLHEIRM